jgi:hypothetical protein
MIVAIDVFQLFRTDRWPLSGWAIPTNEKENASRSGFSVQGSAFKVQRLRFSVRRFFAALRETPSVDCQYLFRAK